MSNQPNQTNQPNQKYIDIIAILDASGSMEYMGKEPIQAINAFIETQKETATGKETFSLITFSTLFKTIIDNENLLSMEPVNQNSYITEGFTALNDAICSTIKTTLESDKPDDKILLVITDGQENASKKYKKSDVKKYISLVEEKNNWKVIFLGANMDALEEGTNLSISQTRCSQFDQQTPGNLLEICRSASDSANKYRRALTNGTNGTNGSIDLILSDNTVKTLSDSFYKPPSNPSKQNPFFKKFVRNLT